MLTLILLLLVETQPLLDERLVDFRLPATRVSSWGLSLDAAAEDELVDTIRSTSNDARAVIGYRTCFVTQTQAQARGTP